MKPDPRIVIAGSRSLAGGLAPRLLVRFLAALPPGAVILLRDRRNGPPGVFEGQTADVCDLLGLEVDWRRPDPEVGGVGREATFRRDLELVADADLVLGFVASGEDYSGTRALIDKALEEDRPAVYCYAIDGGVSRVGEHDPDGIWSDLLGAL